MPVRVGRSSIVHAFRGVRMGLFAKMISQEGDTAVTAPKNHGFLHFDFLGKSESNTLGMKKTDFLGQIVMYQLRRF